VVWGAGWGMAESGWEMVGEGQFIGMEAAGRVITRLSWINFLCTVRLCLNASRRLMFICAVVATRQCHRYIHTAPHCGHANAGSLTCCSEYFTNIPMKVSCVFNRMYPIRLLNAYPNEVAQSSEYAVTCTNTSRFHSASTAHLGFHLAAIHRGE
jgi:hypothetical protein